MFEELEIHIEEIEMYIQNIYKAVNDYASGKYRSLRAFKQSGDKLTAEQKETLRRYTDSIILLLELGMAFHEIKQFLN